MKECKRMKYLSNVDMSFERALEIWKNIYLHILKNYSNYYDNDWLFIHYEQLFEKENLVYLSKLLNTELDEKFPDISLKRTKFNEKIPKEVEKLYLELNKLAGFVEKRSIGPIEKKREKQINDKYYLEIDIQLLQKKKCLKDTEMFRLGENYYKIGDFEEALKWLNSVVKKSKNRVLVFNALKKILDIHYNKKINREIDEHTIKKFLFLILHNKKKKEIDMYQIASLYKKLGKYRLSIKWFKKVLTITKDKHLKGGALFHLGEIKMVSGDMKKARNFFEMCLKVYPSHKKAKDYLKKMKEKG